MDFFATVGSTVFKHDFHIGSLFPFWTDEITAGSLHLGGFPNESVLDLKDYRVTDVVTVASTGAVVATHPAQVSFHIIWQNPSSPAFTISGLTDSHLVSIFPATPSVPQELFSGLMMTDQASGNFTAVDLNADGSTLERFHVEGVKSGFAEVGTETVGTP